VAFESFSDDLSTEDDGAHLDVFVRDMQTGTITLVSRRSASEGGGPADGASQDPAISVDGRFVAFESNAANLSTDDDPAVIQDVYVRDLQAQTTTLVGRQSAADGGDGADDTTFDPAISADGRFVAFDTFADNLSAEDTGSRDVFVRDVVAQTTTLVSREYAATGGEASDGNSCVGGISGNGRVVAFRSFGDDLSTEDIAGGDLFVRDLDALTTTFASRATGAGGAAADASTEAAVISADGNRVAFLTEANNLSTEDTDNEQDVFVRDLAAATTTLATRATGAAGAAADDRSFTLAISGDGRYVAFDGNADNLSSAANPAVINVFVRDLALGTTTFVSRAAGAAGAAGDGTSDDPAVSGDGRYVAFESTADTLSPLDDDGVQDVFRRDVLGAPTAPPAGQPTAASNLCAAAAPAAAGSGGSGKVTLTVTQLRINQRISQAAIRRLNAIAAWLDAGIQGRDVCGGAVGPAELAAGAATAARLASIALLQRADPRPITPRPATSDPDARFSLTEAQLLINQRIDQAGVRRANALDARLAGGLTGGDVADRAITQGKLHDRLAVTAAPAAAPVAASVTRIAPAGRRNPGSVTLSVEQLRINQRIAQAAVRRSNALIARLERGLTAADLRDGSIGAADLAAGVAP
jgi:Tol biopolymer transport system component